jgi:hypothetical protein
MERSVTPSRNWPSVPCAARTAALLIALLVCSCSTSRKTDPRGLADGSQNVAATLLLSNLLERPITTDRELVVIVSEANGLREVARADIERAKTERPFPKRELAERSLEEIRSYFHSPPGLLTKRDLRGLDEVYRLASAATNSDVATDRSKALAELREVMAAMRNNRRPTVPPSIGVLLPWKLMLRDHDRSIGRGAFPASNVVSNRVPGSVRVADLSRLDPHESTFWRRPESIPLQDLHAGFGRSAIPVLTNDVCKYSGPKTSAGTKAGIEVECNGVEYQVKFLEVSSEPFTARVFHALGYNVDPTDYVPGLKVRYDRRLLRELNLRSPLRMGIRPFGIPLGSVDFQPHYSPFDYIVAAVFKDGSRISARELRQQIFHEPDGREPEADPKNFRTEVEASLDYVITAPANVQLKDQPSETIGMWEFHGLGHEDLRELRGAGLLSAWLGWFDARFDNTRLRVLKTNGVVQLLHYFTDLGAGMGGGNGWFIRHGENPDYFEPVFTRSTIQGGASGRNRSFEVIHYQTVLPCPAFREMTADDARWMARMIAQLTPSQLRDALVASGYDAATAGRYLEKLIRRRDRMILDLGLGEEIQLLQHLGK